MNNLPIFIIGTQRSGSNLLRLLLNQLDEIASPHPPHILKRMYPLLEYYGDLSKPYNFQQLVSDVCRLVELNPIPWKNVQLDRLNVISRCRESSLLSIFGSVYDICAEAWGAKTWCCKSLENIEYVDEIDRYFLNPRYIYLYRDGRDVALSFQKAVVGEKHFFNIAMNWANTQSIALNLMDKIDSSRFFSISYEELIKDPEQSMKRLCLYLEVKYDSHMLEFYRSEEALLSAESSTLWGGLTQPILKDNTQKFLQEASQEDIKIFESVAGDILDRLGYDRLFVKQGEEICFSQSETDNFCNKNKRLKKEALSNIDKEDLKRRDLQENLLTEIKSRELPFNQQSVG
jgi:hypothetical protein